MPSNKKKGRKTTRKAGEGAAVPLPPPLSSRERARLPECLRECRHAHPGHCDECMWTYWPGCMHTLSEEERLSDHMNVRMQLFADLLEEMEQGVNFEDYWDRQEHRHLLDNDMLRVVAYTIVRWILMTERSERNSGGQRQIRQGNIRGFLRDLMSIYAVQKLGSLASMRHATSAVAKGLGDTLEPAQNKFACLEETLSAYLFGGEDIDREYYGVIHLVDKITPCSCLKVHLRRLKLPVSTGGSDDAAFHCLNLDCHKQETESVKLLECSQCQMAQYCSVDCQRKHWRETCNLGAPHKVVCKDICEFFAVFRPPVATGSS